MSTCELIEKCIFFNDQMANMPSTADVYKRMYCKENSSECARFLVCKKLGRDRVPANLFPNETSRAQQLMAG